METLDNTSSIQPLDNWGQMPSLDNPRKVKTFLSFQNDEEIWNPNLLHSIHSIKNLTQTCRLFQQTIQPEQLVKTILQERHDTDHF